MPSNLTHAVTLTFERHDLQPPVFVAGSFTQPPWQPIQMELSVSKQEGGEAIAFSKTFDIPEGQWEYKFKLGVGDWWVCDERAKIGESLTYVQLAGTHT